MNLNKASLLGNLVRDPSQRALPSGQKVTNFSVATNHTWKDVKTKEKKENVEYHNVIAWGKLSEIISQYLKKGDKVYLEGRLQTRSWTDKEGNKKSRTEVIADNLIMLGKSSKREKVKETVVPEEINVEEVPVEN